jgi:AmmeMemoRadiSam system protein A
LTAADRAALLRVARGALRASLGGGAPPPVPDTPAVRARRGVFVTLELEGALRGCVGRPRADRALGALVGEMAVAAARDDPRFPPVSSDELEALRIAISVLTEPYKLQPVGVEGIAIGRDGLLVRGRDGSGVLLPQVAAEQGWAPDAFLAAACRKAGLAPDAWRQPGTEVFTFQADVFGETGEEGKGNSEG